VSSALSLKKKLNILVVISSTTVPGLGYFYYRAKKNELLPHSGEAGPVKLAMSEGNRERKKKIGSRTRSISSKTT